MDEALRQYQRDIWKARLSRRGFMAAMGAAGAGAALAACSGNQASSAPSTVPTVAPPSDGPSAVPASPTPVPSYVLETELYLYNWSEYFSPDNKKAFSEEFGITNFVEDPFASNEEMLAKLQAGGKGQYDITVPTAEYSETLAKGGFLQKIDKSRLPNLAHVNPRFLTMPFDPTDEYLVPKDWGTTGIIHRGSDKEPITSWADFWNLA
ncbi:MAG: twin-arginine translocation signal domain-containing protein, partial [Chloroflexota bacterium]|nr:twin-arginine translocation signal domain-containing protein [Chloroflexota bacterium]